MKALLEDWIPASAGMTELKEQVNTLIARFGCSAGTSCCCGLALILSILFILSKILGSYGHFD